MAEQVKVLVIKPDDLSLIPGTHMVHGEKFQKLSSGIYIHTYIHIHTQWHISADTHDFN